MRQRRVMLVVAGVVALAAPGVRAGQPTAGLPPSLRVLVAADEMPEVFSFAEEGRLGFERELLEGFCRLHGLRLEVVPVSDFEQTIPKLLGGEGDVIAGIVDTVPRRQRVLFTTEVLPVRHLAVTRRPGPVATRVEELRRMRTGVIPGTAWEAATAEAGVPEAKRIEFRDVAALLTGLRAGEVDAVVMALLDFALAKTHDPDLVAGPFVGAQTSAAMAVRPSDGRLLDALNGYLLGMRPARDALMFKYLSEDALSLIALARRE